MIIVYRSHVDEEIIVTTLVQEKSMIRNYFFPNSGRTKSDYQREELDAIKNPAVVITPQFRVEW